MNYVDKHSYLGVTLDTNLKWQYHLQEISSKATKILNLIKRNFWFCEQDTKNTLYKALVRPKMKYASVVGDPYHQYGIDKLENIQRAAARFCKNDYRHTSSVTAMIKDLEWDSLASRRKRARLCTMYEITHNIIHLNKDKSLRPTRKTRTRGTHNFSKYYIEFPSNDIYKFSYFPRTIREWNCLPSEIVSAESLNSFDNHLWINLRD